VTPPSATTDAASPSAAPTVDAGAGPSDQEVLAKLMKDVETGMTAKDRADTLDKIAEPRGGLPLVELLIKAAKLASGRERDQRLAELRTALFVILDPRTIEPLDRFANALPDDKLAPALHGLVGEMIGRLGDARALPHLVKRFQSDEREGGLSTLDSAAGMLAELGFGSPDLRRDVKRLAEPVARGWLLGMVRDHDDAATEVIVATGATDLFPILRKHADATLPNPPAEKDDIVWLRAGRALGLLARARDPSFWPLAVKHANRRGPVKSPETEGKINLRYIDRSLDLHEALARALVHWGDPKGYPLMEKVRLAILSFGVEEGFCRNFALVADDLQAKEMQTSRHMCWREVLMHRGIELRAERATEILDSFAAGESERDVKVVGLARFGLDDKQAGLVEEHAAKRGGKLQDDALLALAFGATSPARADAALGIAKTKPEVMKRGKEIFTRALFDVGVKDLERGVLERWARIAPSFGIDLRESHKFFEVHSGYARIPLRSALLARSKTSDKDRAAMRSVAAVIGERGIALALAP